MMMALKKRKKQHPIKIGPFIVLSSFLVVWFVGIASGEPVRVVEQAIRICLSCIGIG